MTTTLTGRPAARGTATGRPVVVDTKADLKNVAAGDIIVTAQTDITFVPAMHRAGAIVTETGGRFCHAAVWARENGKPTLLQVVDARKLLANLDQVTVDADAGTITWEAER